MRVPLNLVLALIGGISVSQLATDLPAKSADAQAINKQTAAASNALEFEEFRKKVLAALAKKDRQFIVNMLSPKVLTALGGETGKEAFARQWQNLSTESEFWERFNRVLKHGAQFDDGTNEFHAPAINFADTHSELPQAIIWDREALIYKDPSNLIEGVRAPFREQVSLLDPASPEPVRRPVAKIKTKNGHVFYIRSMHIYSAYDEFAVFKKEDGKWQLSWFGYASL